MADFAIYRLAAFAWMFCPDDCPCENEVFNPLVQYYEDEHILSGLKTDFEQRDVELETSAKFAEYTKLDDELSRLVRRRGFPEEEKCAQLRALRQELAARPWASKRGKEIAAAIKDYHDSGKKPAVLEPTIPLLEHKPALAIEHVLILDGEEVEA